MCDAVSVEINIQRGNLMTSLHSRSLMFYKNIALVVIFVVVGQHQHPFFIP
jgi:hypothetical protein